MPRYGSDEEIQAEDRESRARAYLAQARLYADKVNAIKEKSGPIYGTGADSMAIMNALLAIAEMAVPPEPGMRHMTRPL